MEATAQTCWLSMRSLAGTEPLPASHHGCSFGGTAGTRGLPSSEGLSLLSVAQGRGQGPEEGMEAASAF